MKGKCKLCKKIKDIDPQSKLCRKCTNLLKEGYTAQRHTGGNKMKEIIKIKVYWDEDNKGNFIIDEDYMREELERELTKLKETNECNTAS